MYPENRPAKRRRALVETTSPRDNRMGWRRISVQGGLRASPPTICKDIQSYPPCLENSRGSGAAPPTPNGHFP